MPSKLFVGNLAFSATEDAVKTLFSQYGEVTSVNIITDKMSGRPRGFCFVEMENADAAIEGLNNSQFEGRKLNVNVAQQKPQSSGGGGGGRPRSSGGGGGGGGFNRDRGGSGGNRRNDRDRW
jgi:RNA recognition motif-containing protein